MVQIKKWWERFDGTIAEFANDTCNIGDTREVIEKFPICEHCGDTIIYTQFGLCDINGERILTLCEKCDRNGYYTKTKKALKIKKRDKGILVKQKCCGFGREFMENNIGGIIAPVRIQQVSHSK